MELDTVVFVNSRLESHHASRLCPDGWEPPRCGSSSLPRDGFRIGLVCSPRCAPRRLPPEPDCMLVPPPRPAAPARSPEGRTSGGVRILLRLVRRPRSCCMGRRLLLLGWDRWDRRPCHPASSPSPVTFGPDVGCPPPRLWL